MPRTPKSENTPVSPMAFAGDVTAWATWLYYAEECTQAEVATRMGVSRASVANYLAEARRQGLVSIQVNPELLARTNPAKALARTFGLVDAAVIPTPPGAGAGALRTSLGRAGAVALRPYLRPDATLGVAWGRTVAALGQALPEQQFTDLRVVQISGGSLGDDAWSPEACTLQIASRLGGRCHNFNAPAVVSNQKLRDALLAEPALIHHFKRVASCETVVFGVGELDDKTRWADGDMLIRPSAQAYRKNGSVAVVIGRFIDRHGQECDGPLSGRRIGMTLGDLRKIKVRMCVAGGPEKREAIRAVLSGGFVTHMITDSETAAALLGEEKAP